MFQIHRPYTPAGDQPEAIQALVKGLQEGETFLTLLGVTGSGKRLPLLMLFKIFKDLFYKTQKSIFKF